MDHIGSEADDALGEKAVPEHVIHIAVNIVRGAALERVDLVAAFEHAGVHHPDLEEHEIFEHPGEDPVDVEQGMQAQAVEAVDQHHRGFALRVKRGRSVVRMSGAHFRRFHGRFHQAVQLRDHLSNLGIMALDQVCGSNQYAGDGQGCPTALGEFGQDDADQDKAAEDQAEPVDQETAAPARNPPAFLPPVPDHSELGKDKGYEDIDAVKDQQQTHGPARDHHQSQGGASHEQDPVLGDQPVAEHGKAGREPAVLRHIRKHLRAADKAGLGRGEQDGRLREQGDQDEGIGKVAAPMRAELGEQCRVQGLAGQ